MSADLDRSILQQFAAETSAERLRGIRDCACGVLALEHGKWMTRASPGLPQSRDRGEDPFVILIVHYR
jgi:hypothetical protein